MKLALIGDLHYPDFLTSSEPAKKEARDAFFDTFIDSFLALDADYHISVGDLAHAGEFSEFHYMMNKIETSAKRRRFLHVLGNHDTYTYPKPDILALTRQERYGVIEEEEAIIVLLDTARETRDDWSGMLDEEQLAWLESQMTRKADKPLFVFAHHPLYGTTARSTEDMMSIHPSLDLWPVLEQWPGIGFYFNGHNHVHSIVRRDRWHFIQTAAVPDLPAVRIVTVAGGEISLDTLTMTSDAFTGWASEFTGSMYDYDIRTDAEGNSAAAKLNVSRPHAGEMRVDPL